MTQTSIQTLNDFVRSVTSGRINFATAGRAEGKIIEYAAKLDAGNIAAIAAEAINRDIVDSEKVSWDQLIKQISSIISGLKS